MKAISLWQPWASLIAWGEKEYETRSWETNHRGLIAIHAAKRPIPRNGFPGDAAQFRSAFERHECSDMYGLPRGAVLCICELVSTHTTYDLKVSHHYFDINLTPKERAFGNFGVGRFAWKLKLIEVFDTPIPCSGKQGLWNWSRPS